MKIRWIVILLAGLLAAVLSAGYALTSSSSNYDGPDEANGVASSPNAVSPVSNACARFAAGSIVQNPPDLFSQNGALKVNLSYQTATDPEGRTLFCFMTPDGHEDPTLHVNPGDTLVITLTNNTPATTDTLQLNPPHCGANEVTASSVNMHFHGLNISPACHQDDVVRTMVNPGKTFVYRVHFPTDEAPGLYWYHTHVHGLVDASIQGGATGAIVVEGIQNYYPQVAGLQQQILLIRDQSLASPTATATTGPTPAPTATPTFTPVPACSDAPTPAPTPTFVPTCSGASEDLTLNFVDIGCPETPAIIQMPAGATPQLWRVVNSSGDDTVDLQVQYDGVPQPLQIVGLDGVPVNSQDGAVTPVAAPTPITATDILLTAGNRAEFMVSPPGPSVSDAQLVTLPVNDGPAGGNFPGRTLALIQTLSSCTSSSAPTSQVSTAVGPRWKQRFAGLAEATPTTTRTLYFSEDFPAFPTTLLDFYITVDGATPTLFYYNDPPAIVTHRGAVEEWTIENRSQESHVFHIHQIHFLVESLNNFPAGAPSTTLAPVIDNQFLDSIIVPYWDGVSAYPSVTLKMDFRGPVVGDFVYHCHFTFHEDNGMMAIIRVMPSQTAALFEKARIYLASLPLFAGRKAAEREKALAWCYRGRAVRRRDTAALNDRTLAQRAPLSVSAR
jgi:FtsP/CotA-like multicopper oxidase with cupredoxin domain